jgi:creatinine amidohydrolase
MVELPRIHHVKGERMGNDATLELERMTWPQVRAALDAGRTTVVFACGAVEQHGPHLPLFTDAEHGTELARRVASALGDALVAPTVRVGCSEHHMAFPGTISLEESTFAAVLRDYVRSLARHGFRRICVIPSHGGNFAPLTHALPMLREAAGERAHVAAFTDLQSVIGGWVRLAGTLGLAERVGGHADIAESSVMLALHPELVHMDAAEAGHVGPLTPELIQRLFTQGMRAISPNGILGDARGLSADLGQRCIEELVTVLVAYFRREATEGTSIA